MNGEYPLGNPPVLGFRAPGAWSKSERAAGAAAAGANTTIAVVATDAAITRPEARRLAIMAADGMAKAVRPIHTPFDGDTVIALATGRVGLLEPRPLGLSALGTLAADTLARAIARGVWEASGIPGWPSYRESLGPGG
jgi:L-aminopeptidase/D-esterase-like protein